jgi:predicted hotdog family 3-hydroxylacyl-ACP dehydratase
MEPEDLIPHAGPMCWLDRVVDHDAARTRCSLVVRESTPLAGAGPRVPAHAALEYMAQTAAVHAALAMASGEAGRAPAPGSVALLGTRSLELERAWLEPGESLVTEAAPVTARSSGLAVFAASVRDEHGREIARARLNLYAGATVDG